MTARAAATTAAAFTATAIVMPGNKIMIYMFQGKEQGNSQYYTYYIGRHSNSSLINQKPKSLPI